MIVTGSSQEVAIKLIEQYYPSVKCPNAYRQYVLTKTEKEVGSHVDLKPGVKDFIKYAKEQGLKLAIASSSFMSHIKNCLTNTGLIDSFDAIVCDEDVKNGKPAPEIFEKAASKLGLKPSQCVVFEDSRNGIFGSHDANCKTVLIPDTIKPTPEIASKCDGIYTSFCEVLEYIKNPE